jgi:hypothetical protein
MAVSTWTGTELLIWGGQNDYESSLHDGAAYNPSTGDWRMLANGPLEGSDHAGSTWTGTEWVIAAENKSGDVEVAAYDPAADSWRTLPSVTDEYSDPPTIAWTGSEILLFTAAGLFSMPAGGTEWVAEYQSSEWHGPGLWTGDLLVAQGSTEYGSDPLGSDYLNYPVAWDPTTRSTVDLAIPARNVYDGVLAGSRLAFFDQGLALDLTTNAWVALDLSEEAVKALELIGHTAVWADDRLLVWGGILDCGETPPTFGTMVELIPEWAPVRSVATPSARYVAATTAFADLAGTEDSSSVSFAC